MNRPTTSTTLYEIRFVDKWKYARIAAKLVFVYVGIIATVILSIRTYKSQHLIVNTHPIEQGVYEVKEFTGGSLPWEDLALYGVTGSINTADTLFEQRYNRGYFSFEVDTVTQQLRMKRNYDDTDYIMSLRYEIPAENTLILKNDSLVVVLTKKEPYRLARPHQFHWLQERSQ